MREKPTGLYLLTPDWTDTPRLVAATARALRGGVRWLQYRQKNADAPLKREQAHCLRELTWAEGVRLVINDDADLAIAARADGVHVGRDDPDPRPRLARDGGAMLVGVSCYDTFERAQAATATGADYVAFGSMFASPTKPAAVRAPLALLGRAHAAGMHAVAIGGIDAGNIAQVAAAGADAAALISAVYDAPDPEAAVRQLLRAFSEGLRQRQAMEPI